MIRFVKSLRLLCQVSLALVLLGNMDFAAGQTITVSAVTGTITTCPGTASTSPNLQHFFVAGGSLTGAIVLTAPAGFDLSLLMGSSYGSSVSLNPSGGTVPNTIIFVRAQAASTLGPIGGQVSISSPGVTSANVHVQATIESGPAVNAIPNQILNSGETTQAILLTTTGGSSLYSWNNDSPSIGVPASGTAFIPPFLATNLGTTPVTATFSATAVSTSFAYIPVASDSVYVLKTSTQQKVGAIAVGHFPVSALASPDNQRVYVANKSSNSVSVINTGTNQVITTIPVGDSPTAMILSPSSNTLYVANEAAPSLTEINTATNTVVGTIVLNHSPTDLAVKPDGSLVYVTSIGGLLVVNANTHAQVATIAVGSILATPQGIAISPDGTKLYVVLGGLFDNAVAVIRTSNNTLMNTIPVGSNPYGVAVSADGSRIYVANTNSHSVSVINTVTGSLITSIPLGLSPTGLSISPDGNYVYVVDSFFGPAAIISTLTNTVVNTLDDLPSISSSMIGNFFTAGTGCSGLPRLFTITVNPHVPVIATTAPTGVIVSCAGSPSSSAQLEEFSVSGDHFVASLTVTAPADFDISLNANSGFGKSLTLTPSGGLLLPTLIYVRSSSNALPGIHSENVTITSLNLTPTTVPVRGTVYAFPVVQSVPDQTFITGKNTPPIDLDGTATLYSWVNTNPAIGLAANGSGNAIPSFVANNGARADTVVASVTVTPVSQTFAYIRAFENGGYDNILVVNVATGQVVSTIPLIFFPYGYLTGHAPSPDGKWLYLTAGDILYRIDTRTKKVVGTRELGGFAVALVVSPDGSRIYTLNNDNPSISVIDAVTNTVVTNIPLRPGNVGLAINQDGNRLFVTNQEDASLTIIDTNTNLIVSTASTFGEPFGMAISPDGSTVFIEDNFSNKVSVINASTGQLIHTISVNKPSGLAVSLDGSKLYISLDEDGAVSVIDVKTADLKATITVGTNPAGMAASADGNTIYVVNRSSENMSVIDTHTNTAVNTIPVNFMPGAITLLNGSGCVGQPTTFAITIIPIPPQLIASPADGTIVACHGSASTGVDLQQIGISGSYLVSSVVITAPAGFIISKDSNSGFASSLSLTPTDSTLNSTSIYVRTSAAAPQGNIDGNVTFATNHAVPQNVLVSALVAPLPTLNPVLLQELSSGVKSAPIQFSGTGGTLDYLWTNTNTSIGLPASGSGNIPGFIPSNAGPGSATATITVTPRSTAFLYVPDRSDSSVHVINTLTDQVVARIPVGHYPSSGVVSPDGTRVYVPNIGSNNISVINTGINKVIASIAVGPFPYTLALSPDGQKLYCSTTEDQSVSVINTATNEVELSFPSLFDNMVLSPDGNLLYGSYKEPSYQPIVISTTGYQPVGFASLQTVPSALCLNRDGSVLYLGTNPIPQSYVSPYSRIKMLKGFQGGQLMDTIKSIFLPGTFEVSAMNITPDGKYLFASCSSGKVYIIKTDDFTISKILDLGNPSTLGISFTLNGSKAYVIHDQTISVIDVRKQVLIKVIPVGVMNYTYTQYITKGTGCPGAPKSFNIVVQPAAMALPFISVQDATGSILTCAGTASSAPHVQNFIISAHNLSAALEVDAPPDFEISNIPGGVYHESLSLILAGSVRDTTIFVRAKSNARSGIIFGQVTLTSPGAALQQVDVNGYVTPQPNLVSKTLREGRVNMNYADAIFGLSDDFIFSANGLPAGLSMESWGAIQGIPTQGTDGPAAIPVSASNGFCSQTLPYYLNILKADGSVFVIPAYVAYDGTPKPVSVVTNPAGLTVAVLYNGFSSVPVNPGFYSVTATIVSDSYTGTATGQLTITGTVLITFSNTVQTYDGNSKAVIITTDPPNTPASITYNGSSSLPVNAGTYTLYAQLVNPAPYYSGSATGTLTINKVPLGIAADNKSKPYGNANPVLTRSYFGLVNGEPSSVIDVLPAIATTAQQNSDAGIYPITLSGGSDNNYAISLQVGELTITQVGQTIAFAPIEDQVPDAPPITLTAVASSGLPVSFDVTAGTATVSGDILTLTGTGDITVKASQSGNQNYLAASVEQTFAVEIQTGLEPRESSDVEVFPIPTETWLSVTLPKSWGESSLQLYDMQGNLVLTTRAAAAAKLKVTQLSGGLYLLRVSNGRDEAVRRVIIL